MSSEPTPPGQPPQGKSSRWRRRRPAPAAARPLIFFSLVSAIVFTAALSVVFVPRIIDSLNRENIPQFFLQASVEAQNASVTVTDATGPRGYSILAVELWVNDSNERVNMTLLANGSAAGVTYFPRGTSGQVEQEDRFIVRTVPNRTYHFYLVYLISGERVGGASWST